MDFSTVTSGLPLAEYSGYNLEYRFDNKKVDLSNVYTYCKSIINFLEGCDYKFYEIENY